MLDKQHVNILDSLFRMVIITEGVNSLSFIPIHSSDWLQNDNLSTISHQ